MAWMAATEVRLACEGFPHQRLEESHAETAQGGAGQVRLHDLLPCEDARPRVYVYDLPEVEELSQGASFCGKGQWGMEARRVECLAATFARCISMNGCSLPGTCHKLSSASHEDVAKDPERGGRGLLLRAGLQHLYV